MARKTGTKERILEVAEEMFAQRGFAATSITDIADQVGIRGPGVYKHYNNKLEIYEAVLERLFKPMTGVVTTMRTGASPEDIQHQIQVVMNHHIAHPNIARLIQHATMAGGETLEHLADKWYRPFFNFIREVAEDEKHSWVNTPGVMAIHSMLLGYVTLAPLHQKIFDRNPLDADMVAEQMQFYRQLVGALSQLGETA